MLHIAAIGHLLETGDDLGVADDVVEGGWGVCFDPHCWEGGRELGGVLKKVYMNGWCVIMYR